MMYQSRVVCLFTRQGILRTCPSQAPKVLSLVNTRSKGGICGPWPASKPTRMSGIIQHGSSSLSKVFLSTDALLSDASHLEAKKNVMSFKTVKELLDFFESSSNSLDTINKVAVLHMIAKIIQKDGIQRIELQKIRASSQKGHSMFKDLLNNIADNLSSSNLDYRHLANVIWSLDKIQETNHSLYQICNNEMELRGPRKMS